MWLRVHAIVMRAMVACLPSARRHLFTIAATTYSDHAKLARFLVGVAVMTSCSKELALDTSAFTHEVARCILSCH